MLKPIVKSRTNSRHELDNILKAESFNLATSNMMLDVPLVRYIATEFPWYGTTQVTINMYLSLSYIANVWHESCPGIPEMRLHQRRPALEPSSSVQVELDRNNEDLSLDSHAAKLSSAEWALEKSPSDFVGIGSQFETGLESN